MPDTQNRDQERENLEQKYQDSPDQDDVDRGIREAEGFANQSDGESDSENQSEEGSGSDEKGGGFFSGAEGAAGSLLDKTAVGRGIKPALQVIGRNKGKSGAAGGIVALILTLTLAGFFGLKQFELMHMLKTFHNYAFVASEYTEGSRTSRLLAKTFQRGRNMDPDRARTSGNQRRTGRLIGDWVNDSRLNKLESNLQQKGYTFEYKTDTAGNRVATGIRRVGQADPIPLEQFRQARGEIRSLVKEEVPAYRVGKRFRYHQLMFYRTGWNRRFFTGRTRANAAQRLRARVRGESYEPDTRPRDSDSEVSDEQRQRVESELTEQRNEVNELVQDARQGRSISLRGTGIGLSVAGLVSMKCLAENIEDQVGGSERARYEGPMALSQQISTGAHQAKVGGETVSSEEYGQLMEVFHDPPTEENPTGEHWDETANAKRAMGVQPTGDEPDLEDGYFVPDGGFSGFIRTAIAQPLVSLVGGTLEIGRDACEAVGNTGVQLAADSIELLASFGVGKALFIAGEWALEETGALTAVLREGINWIAGNINCMQYASSPHLAANCLSAGMILNNTEHTRSNMGAPPLPDDQYDEVRDKAQDAQHDFLAQKGHFHKYLSPDNPYSMTSQVAVALPKTLDGLVQKTATIPSYLVDSLGSIFISSVDAQWRQGDEYKTYGLEHFGFTEEEIQNTDPVENENRVLNYLNYYCWQDRDGNTYEVYDGEGYEGCDTSRFTIALNMREYLYCSQLPYNEPADGGDYWRDSHCQERYRRQGGNQWLSENNLVSIGMWMFDRYTIENMSQLTSDVQLNDEITFDLLKKIERCAEEIEEEPRAEMGEFPNPPYNENNPPIPLECYEVVDNEGSIFYSKGYIEGEGSSATIDDSGGDSGGSGNNGSDNADLPNGTTEELAGQILNHPNIIFDGRTGGRVRNSFVQASEDGTASLYTRNGPRVEVSSALLGVILRIANRTGMPTVRISSLTTGSHSINSTHYSGQGVDIGNESIAGQVIPFVYQNRGNFNIHELIYASPPGNTQNLKFGQPYSYPSGTIDSHADHIHISTLQ